MLSRFLCRFIFECKNRAQKAGPAFGFHNFCRKFFDAWLCIFVSAFAFACVDDIIRRQKDPIIDAVCFGDQLRIYPDPKKTTDVVRIPSEKAIIFSAICVIVIFYAPFLHFHNSKKRKGQKALCVFLFSLRSSRRCASSHRTLIRYRRQASAECAHGQDCDRGGGF